MNKREKYNGLFPAFYACYDDEGNISPERTKAFAIYLRDKGVKGLYVGGSSGECIYHSKEDRKIALESVMDAVGKDLVIIAHVACNNTKDSCDLAAHAQSLGVDAIAAIPPIYFKLPDFAIEKYWNDISAAAPDTDFFIYNIPQLAGVSLNSNLMSAMLKNPRVIGVKNSSMPVQDIQMWNDLGAIVMNGPDEQLLSGLCAGAVGGIGGTYAVMPELYLKIIDCYKKGDLKTGYLVQNECCRIIYKLCSGKSNMYAMIKETIRIMDGPSCGGVREPLMNMIPGEEKIAQECASMIKTAIATYSE